MFSPCTLWDPTDPRNWRMPSDVPLPEKFDFIGSKNRGTLHKDWRRWRDSMIAYMRRSGVAYLSPDGQDDGESAERHETLEKIKKRLLLSCLSRDTASTLCRLCGDQRLQKVLASEIVRALILHVKHFESVMGHTGQRAVDDGNANIVAGALTHLTTEERC